MIWKRIRNLMFVGSGVFALQTGGCFIQELIDTILGGLGTGG